MIILVPCKHLAVGKSRLSPCLNDRERHNLCELLLDSTLELATSLVDASHIRVVTADPDAWEIASHRRILTIQDTTGDLNSALRNAREQLTSEGTRTSPLMVLPIDLPFATREAVSVAVDLPGDVVIAGDEAGTGTNLLLLREAASNFAFRFGPESFSRHVSQARTAGLSIAFASGWRLARDIDNPDQYAAWRTQIVEGQ
jgi:2-phospho-L-lactate guanylyltransferase